MTSYMYIDMMTFLRGYETISGNINIFKNFEISIIIVINKSFYIYIFYHLT